MRRRGALSRAAGALARLLASVVVGGGIALAAPQSLSPKAVAGSWVSYSATLYYDAGGGAFPVGPVSLVINGRLWRWGSSSGTYALHPIVPSDWKQWGVRLYGPTEKIVLNNWEHGRVSGPLEISHGRVVFLWVAYRVAPPTVQAAGTVYLKFGRQNP